MPFFTLLSGVFLTSRHVPLSPPSYSLTLNLSGQVPLPYQLLKFHTDTPSLPNSLSVSEVVHFQWDI